MSLPNNKREQHILKSNKYLLHVSRICCGLTIGIGAIAISGWLLGLRLLASISYKYIPMAPNTAVAFIAMGIAAIVLHSLPLHRMFRWISALLSLCVVTLGILTLLQYFHVIMFDINQALVKCTGGPFGNVPVGYMSPPYGRKFHSGGCIALFINVALFQKTYTQYRVVSRHYSYHGRKHCHAWISLRDAYSLRWLYSANGNEHGLCLCFGRYQPYSVGGS